MDTKKLRNSIQELQHVCKTLDRQIKLIGTARDDNQLRKQLHDMQINGNKICNRIMYDLYEVYSVDRPRLSLQE